MLIKEKNVETFEVNVFVFFFFFKQKTAYEIVSRDWSSDVCSSDLKNFKNFPEEQPSCSVEDSLFPLLMQWNITTGCVISGRNNWKIYISHVVGKMSSAWKITLVMSWNASSSYASSLGLTN